MNDHHATEGFQLSPQQMRLWRLQEDAYGASTRLIPWDHPRGSIYRAHCSFLLNGSLNVNRLQVAIDKAVSRHEAYRTYLCRLPGMKFPLQVVAARAVFIWQQVNLCDDAPEKPTLCLEEIAEEQKQRPIDLEHGPLLHFSLVSLSDHKHILFLDLSAFHADNRSLIYLMSTIAECYGTDLEEHKLSDIDDVVQYIQFSEWQHALLAEAESRIGREYWGKLDLSVLSHWGLHDPSSPHPSSSTEVFLPASFAVPAPKGFQAQLSLLLKHYDISAAHFFLACWHILLWRLTGQERSIIAVGTDGRIFEEQAEIAGLLTTYLPMNCILSDHQRFSQILRQVKQVADEASEWQYYWIGEGGTVQGHDEVNGSITRSLRFPFCFDFSRWPAPSVVDGISFSLRECHTYVEPFQIKVSAIHKADDTFMLEFHYNTTLFSIKDIQRVADQYSTLLQRALSQPETRLYELEILSEKARIELLVAFNAKSLDEANVRVAYPGEERFHQLFESQVEQTPDAVAVVSDDVAYGFTSHLTYQELNTRANQLAHWLRRRGVGLDVPVGICLGPSLEMVVGLLGILKAGGAYVPLDPSTPAQRLAFLLEEIQPVLVLIQDRLKADRHRALSLWSSQYGNPTDSVFCMDTQWHRLAQESCTNPRSPVEPSSLAYMIYTSGSTGRPKGVMITHQGLSNYLAWSREHYQVERGYGSVVHSSLSFDLTITSLFLPLASGRTVLLVSEEERIEGLVSVIRRYPYASLLKITPAHLTLLNQMLQAWELPDVTHALVIGGEALAASSVALWRELAPQTRVINEYAPTETVVVCSIHEVTTNGPDTAMVPIGSPIANMQLYILDARGNPVPIGVTGELFIGGLGVARGYKNRPDLTAERFLPHPFSSHPGERLYRSGDLAYYRPDGTIAYLGRLDHQIKLRGYRIELGEIEATLRAYPFVQEAVAVLREEDETRKYLVAYVARASTPLEGESCNQPHQPEELQSYLRKQLPDYMVPARVVELESLPLLPNGKVDRSALAVMDVAEEANQTSVSASTPLQELLGQIWQDVLQRQEIGIHENFFKLGGHSLLATQVIARVHQAFQVDLPLRSLFEAPTIEQFAQLIEAGMRERLFTPVPALLPMERPVDLPLSFAQERLWFLHQWDPGSAWYNVPLALRLSGQFNISALESSLRALVQRHEVLRTTFEERLGRAVQVIKAKQSIQIPVIDLTGSQGLAGESLMRELVRLEAQRPFDLVNGPLLRVSLLGLGAGQAQGTVPTAPQEHVLLLMLHHIVTDGWSMRVLVREMTALYLAEIKREPIKLPDLPIQYADYTLWQRQW